MRASSGTLSLWRRWPVIPTRNPAGSLPTASRAAALDWGGIDLEVIGKMICLNLIARRLAAYLV